MSTAPLVTIPNSIGMGAITITMREVVGSTDSPFTFESQDFKWPGERWVFNIQMPPIVDRDIASDWIAFGLKLKGSYGRFLLGDPSRKNPAGVATGTPLVNGNGQTGQTLQTKGWTHSVTNIMKRGDYIQIGTGLAARLYMVVDPANSDSSGNAILVVCPDLKTHADNDPITVHNAQGLFKMSDPNFSWSAKPNEDYTIQFEAVEDINSA